ncbi:unnamed protein product, partial [Medioppia subpectinata]
MFNKLRFRGGFGGPRLARGVREAIFAFNAFCDNRCATTAQQQSYINCIQNGINRNARIIPILRRCSGSTGATISCNRGRRQQTNRCLIQRSRGRQNLMNFRLQRCFRTVVSLATIDCLVNRYRGLRTLLPLPPGPAGPVVGGGGAARLPSRKKIRHRGPDWSGCIVTDNHIFCHERLAIVGVDSGAQPITNADNSIILTVNGEIYNYLNLKKLLNDPQPYVTQSDCEIILHLYREIGDKVVDHLDGQFAFVLYDKRTNRLIAARDPIGITTLYYGYDSRSPGTVYFASEMKSLNEECDRILAFPPGHLYDSTTGQIRRWFDPNWWSEEVIASAPLDLTLLKRKLEHSVRKRLMSEVPYGVLLSGGLDSSLIASIAVRETRKITGRKTSRAVRAPAIADMDDGNSSN